MTAPNPVLHSMYKKRIEHAGISPESSMRSMVTNATLHSLGVN
jgi:hypothetical protein